MRVTLRQLEVFDAIAQMGSVVGAAESIGLSQSAASLSLQDLEGALGFELFHRQGRRLVLNDHGIRLRAEVNSIVRRVRELGPRGRDDQPSGTIKVGATELIGEYLLPRLFGVFLASHPLASIELVIDVSSNLLDQLENFALDVVFTEGACNRPALHVQDWMSDELCFFCSPDHPLASKPDLSVEDVRNEAWFFHPLNDPSRIRCVSALGEFVTSLRITLLSDRADVIRRAVAAGRSLSCLSRIAVAGDLAAGRLKELSFPEVHTTRLFTIVTHRDRYASLLQTAFLDHVLSEKANTEKLVKTA